MQCFDSLYICMIKISDGSEQEMYHDARVPDDNHHDQLQDDQFTHAGEDR